MKRVVLPALLITSLAAPAMADITHSLSSSVQLTVDGASSVATRLGSTYAVSGTNIKVGTGNNDVFGGLTAGSATAAATIKAGTYVQNTPGNQFSFSESWLQGDAIPGINAGSTVSSTTGQVASIPAFGSTTTFAGGTKGTLAGGVSSLAGGTITSLTAGGSGTTAIGQFISTLNVK
tara:strand:- start:14999 stop:15529 length:531 start_codon:yes stop_codon:yes gene_type:complete